MPYSATAPLPGYYRLLPKTEVTLMFVVRSDRKGAWRFTQTRITFRYDGRTYSETLKSGSKICTDMPDLDPWDHAAC